MYPVTLKEYTVDSHYFEFQGTLWNTLRYPYLDISDLQNWGKKIQTITFNKYICNWTLEVSDILKILWKRGELSPHFHNIFYLLLDFHFKAGIRFSLRDKQLFEISKVEITRVNCILISKVRMKQSTIITWDRQASANNVDPDWMPQNVVSNQGLHCLPLIHQLYRHINKQ